MVHNAQMTYDRSAAQVLRAFRKTPDSWVETNPPVIPASETPADGPPVDGPSVSNALHAEGDDPQNHQGRSEGQPGAWVRSPGDDALWLVVANPVGVLDAAEAYALNTQGLRARLAQLPEPAREGPRVVRSNEHALFVVVPTAAYADEQVTTGKLAMLVTHEGIVTAESGTAGVTDRVAARLTADHSHKGVGPLPVLAALLVELISAASEVELALGDAIAELENVVFKLADDPLTRLYNLKREISEARRALLPLSVELPELGDDHMTSQVEPLRLEKPLLDRLIGHAERIDRHLEGHDSLLSDMLTVRLSQISVRQNEDMRKISAWAAIAAVPTLMAGVYGMNFREMPELSWAWGYPAALGSMAALCVGLYLAFKKAGWL